MSFSIRTGLCLVMAVLLAGFAGCSQKTDSTGEIGLTIAVIPKGTTHEFWKSIHAGAVKAQRELAAQGTKIDLIWKGPLREDDRDQQIQVVENFIGRKVSGIVLAPLDSQALVAPVEAAQRAKIPVVIIDSGLKSESHVSFVATDNFKGGQMGGEELGRLLGGHGKVILLRYQVGSASTEAREAGFLDAMKKFPDIQIASADQYTGPTRESAYQAAQNVLNRFGKDVDGMFAPCEPVTIGITLALKDLGRAGAVKLVGFDAGTQSVEALRAGHAHGLIVQNPVRMGYLGVLSAVQHLQGKSVEKRIDTGVTLVTPENMVHPDIFELLNPPLKEYLGQ